MRQTGAEDATDGIPGYAYVRQSEDRTGEELAVTRQEEDAVALARRRGITIIKVLRDNDLSAAGKKARPGFQELLEGVREDRVRVIIAWDLSRLTRNHKDRYDLIEACIEHRVTICLVQGAEMDMSTPMGVMSAEMFAAFARLENEQKSARQRRANLQAAEAGRRVGGRRPFGYEMDGALRPDEAVAISAGYQMLLTGASLAEIARQWNAAGFHAQKDRKKGEPSPWRADAVRYVLRNPRYAGLRRYRSEKNGEGLWTAQWAAIIPEETWREAEDLLTHPSRRRPPLGGPRLLTGLALCGVCGATVHAGGAVRHYPMYRCSGSFGHVSRKALPIEDHVSAVMAEWLARPEVADYAAGQAVPDTSPLRLERATLESRLETMATQFADGALTSSQLRTITRRIRERLAEIDTDMARAGRVSILTPVLTAVDTRQFWDNATSSQQRALIDMLVTIRIDPAGRGTRIFRSETIRIEAKRPE